MGNTLLVAILFFIAVASFLTLVGWAAVRLAHLYPKDKSSVAASSTTPDIETWRHRLIAAVWLGAVVATTVFFILCIEGSRFLIATSCWCGVRLLVREIVRDSRDSLFVQTMLFGIPTVITVGWLLFPNWATLNSVGLVIVCGVLIAVRHIPTRAVIVVSLVVMTADIIAVYASDTMMQIAAVYNGMPGMLWVPKDWSLARGFGTQNQILELGLGDLFFPGLIMIHVARVALQRNVCLPLVGAYLGYIIGGIIATNVALVTQSPQPATIFLIPAVFVGYRLGRALNDQPRSSHIAL